MCIYIYIYIHISISLYTHCRCYSCIVYNYAMPCYYFIRYISSGPTCSLFAAHETACPGYDGSFGCLVISFIIFFCERLQGRKPLLVNICMQLGLVVSPGLRYLVTRPGCARRSGVPGGEVQHRAWPDEDHLQGPHPEGYGDH